MDVEEQLYSWAVQEKVAPHSKSNLWKKTIVIIVRWLIAVNRIISGWALALHEAKWGKPWRVKQEYIRKGNWFRGGKIERSQTKAVEVFEWEGNRKNRRGNSQPWEDQGEGRKEKS